jgi:DivIVA domain-containing protein
MDEGSSAPTGPRISPADIQRQEFGVSRFGGYRMRDVDEFLDRLTESTEILVAENERLRSGAAPIVGTADLTEVDRQADEILRRARDEAARIVEAARGQQAAMSMGPVDDAQRAAVDAFLTQERAFLQSLATLVQGHAESVKAMARRSRQQADTPRTADEADASEPEPARAEADISLPEAAEDEPDASTGDAGTDPSNEPATSADETVVLEVPQPTSTAAERDRESDPSLKQLFWGEER